MPTRQLTGITQREGDGSVALCAELGIASEGDIVEQARSSFQEALDLFFETASAPELAERLGGEVCVTSLTVTAA